MVCPTKIKSVLKSPLVAGFILYSKLAIAHMYPKQTVGAEVGNKVESGYFSKFCGVFSFLL